jgi:hypothetical protein
VVMVGFLVMVLGHRTVLVSLLGPLSSLDK